MSNIDEFPGRALHNINKQYYKTTVPIHYNETIDLLLFIERFIFI